MRFFPIDPVSIVARRFVLLSRLSYGKNLPSVSSQHLANLKWYQKYRKRLMLDRAKPRAFSPRPILFYPDTDECTQQLNHLS